MSWFESHVYIASWTGTLIAAVAVVKQASIARKPINWNAAVGRLGFLMAISAVLTPSLEHDVRMGLLGLVACWGGFIFIGAIAASRRD